MTGMLIVNANAGGIVGRGPTMAETVRTKLVGAGVDVQLRITDSPSEATQLAAKAAELQYDCVIAAGGDGTVNSVVGGLVGSETAAGIVPVGTANATARALRIPLRNIDAAVKTVANGKKQPVDVGRLADHYFINMAGIGLDAQIADRVHSNNWLSRLGLAGYIVGFTASVSAQRPWQYQCKIDEQQLSGECWAILICNSDTYSWKAQLAPDASVTDGKLRFIIFRACSRAVLAARAARIFLGSASASDCKHTEIVQGTGMIVDTQPPAPWHVEGEPIGRTPVECSIIPRAVNVLRPATNESTS